MKWEPQKFLFLKNWLYNNDLDSSHNYLVLKNIFAC